MNRLNFLPHRKRRQQQQKQRYQLLLASIFATGIALVLVMLLFMDTRQTQQRKLTQILQLAHVRLDQQLDRKTQLLQQIDALKQQLEELDLLQQQRNDAVTLLEELARHTPDGITLDSLRQDATHLSLHGHARAHQDIIHLLAKLNEAGSFGLMKIRHIAQTSHGHDFIMTSSHSAEEIEP